MKPRWWVRGDIDGFFGLFVDNLLQLLLILTLCPLVAGIPVEFVVSTILPGAAVSIVAGNLFYAWQARRLMRREGREDATALPYGINTPSLVAYIFLIMGPVHRETGDPMLAWKAGLAACFLSGVMEWAGAFAGDWLRRNTPRAALLASLAGVAVTFIAMGFVFQIFASPAVALIPMLLIVAAYASRTRLPFGIPGGLAAVVVGVMLAWALRWAGYSGMPDLPPVPPLGFHPPQWHGGSLVSFLTEPEAWKHLSIIIPMGLFNVIGSLQCLESAEAAGDRYATRSSLAVNGAGSVLAALCGSAFPTTIYIGHPGWKNMGARAGYSVLNGVVVTALCLAGAVGLVLRVMPLEATLGIVLWIGLIILAQAFQETPREHALAVGLGLIPSLAAWGLLLIETSLRVAGTTLAATADQFGADLYIQGVFALNQGFLLSSMVLASILVHVIERRFRRAAAWCAAAGGLAATGLIHAWKMGPVGLENHFGFWVAPEFTLAYLAGAAVFLGFDRMARPPANESVPQQK
jgi:AGZA family xanthine/uracil permease-like MFS transporter